MTTRKASHAGSWYSSSPTKLMKELDGWLGSVPADESKRAGVRAVIGPHAGFAYSGETAAWAYSQVDPMPIKRVFVLGPSHRFYLPDCALTKCTTYSTPLGDIPVDVEVVDALRATDEFRDLSLKQDEAEHCVELHLPFIRRLFSPDVKLVPIVVGSLSKSKEAIFADILAPYFDDPTTLVAISTDFCHWGERFDYTYYMPSPGCGPAKETVRSARDLDPARPIWHSIRDLDREAMDIFETFGMWQKDDDEAGGAARPKRAADVHIEFEAYLKRTENTICGRNSLSVLLAAISQLERSAGSDSRPDYKPACGWVKYEQSERILRVDDSSVSYAAGWVKW